MAGHERAGIGRPAAVAWTNRLGKPVPGNAFARRGRGRARQSIGSRPCSYSRGQGSRGNELRRPGCLFSGSELEYSYSAGGAAEATRGDNWIPSTACAT